MKQLQRLLLHQGQRCFFCDQPIPEGEASVEHLAALSNGGPKEDENCVVCCKALNSALGNLSIKEKLRVVLAQRSAFACPRLNGGEMTDASSGKAASSNLDHSLLPAVIENLRKYGSKRPAKLTTLRNAIAGSFPLATKAEVAAVLEILQEQKHVSVNGTKVSYPLLEADA
jgi:hypothetical protein